MKNEQQTIKVPPSDPDKYTDEAIKKTILEYAEKKNKEKEELDAMTWPVWLKYEEFVTWYQIEQKIRENDGKMRLPPPPQEVLDRLANN